MRSATTSRCSWTAATGGRVVALVPTHDEVHELPMAISALRAQTRPPDRIVIVVNNPRGGIEEVARATGEDVVVVPVCWNHCRVTA